MVVTTCSAQGQAVPARQPGEDLYGGADNDTCHFARGDGQDALIDSAGSDCPQFGEGIDFGLLWFR